MQIMKQAVVFSLQRRRYWNHWGQAAQTVENTNQNNLKAIIVFTIIWFKSFVNQKLSYEKVFVGFTWKSSIYNI